MTDSIFLLLSSAGCTFGARAADGHHDVRRAPPAPRVRETLHGTCDPPFETALFFETVLGMMDGAHERTHATVHDC